MLKGQKATNEIKQKMKDNHVDFRREKNPFWSKKHTEESLMKMRKPKIKKPSLYNCKNWLYQKYIIEKLSTVKMAKLANCDSSTIWRWLKIYKIKTRKKTWPLLLGPESANWKGGRRIEDGYVLIYKPKHPYAPKDKYVQEHRLVMEKRLGRYLKKGEIVHHINGKRDDNEDENLFLETRNKHKTTYIEGYKQGFALGLFLSILNIKYGGK